MYGRTNTIFYFILFFFQYNILKFKKKKKKLAAMKTGFGDPGIRKGW